METKMVYLSDRGFTRGVTDAMTLAPIKRAVVELSRSVKDSAPRSEKPTSKAMKPVDESSG